MFRPHVISAIASRNIKTFFTSVIGYLFIVVFVVVSSIIAFGPKFFADNLATLDQLTEAFPMLLLFLIPAISMGVWADEKKQGTDAILFTLPASDFEILIGKYLSVMVVYAAALLFSTTQLVALANIGTPDWGVVASTYIGYFLAGSALLSVGMFASSLTSNTTVAFVLGAVFCAIPVFIGVIAPGNQVLQPLSLGWQLREFGEGSIALSNVLYFVFLKKIGLFLNYVVITRRHWASDEQGTLLWLYGSQVASVLIIAGSIYYVADRANKFVDTELDLTSQRINTLSATTVGAVRETAAKQTVEIQAFVSSEVPADFVAVKKRLLRLLRQFAQIGGEKIDLRVVEVVANSKAEMEASAAGIDPIDHVSEVGGKQIRQNVYMGMIVTSPIGQSTIPKIDDQTPLEYTLARAIGTVSKKQNKLRLGVLETTASYLGAPDGLELNHRIVDELKRRYNVVRVPLSDLEGMISQQKDDAKQTAKSASKDDEKAKEDKASGKEDETKDGDEKASEKETSKEPRMIIPDVLMVVRPSTLSVEDQEKIVDYMELGNPVFIMVDPLAVFPWSTLEFAPGQVIETPTRALQPGVGPDNRENNDMTTLFDVLQIKVLGENRPATVAGTPPQRSPFGPPSGGSPPRETTAFYPTVAAQMYRPFDELRFSDAKFAYRFGSSESSMELRLGEEIDGIPRSLGAPMALMVNNITRTDFDPFNRESVLTSGIDNVLMFYAGGITEIPFEQAKKAFDDKYAAIVKGAEVMNAEGEKPEIPEKKELLDLKFTSVIRPEKDALGLNWNDIVRKVDAAASFQQPPDSYQIIETPEFYRFELKIKELDDIINATAEEGVSAEEYKAGIEAAKLKKEQLLKDQQKFLLGDASFAVHVTGKRFEDGNELNAVVVADSDFATNLFSALESQINRKPDNLAFLMNVIDGLGGNDEFVELRARNPQPPTLTYMDRKREIYRNARLQKERVMRMEFQNKVAEINKELEKKDSESEAAGLARVVQQLTNQNHAAAVLRDEREMLQNKLKKEIAELKSDEAQKIRRTEREVRYQAIFLPPLPALILGIFVFLYRLVQERSDSDRRR